MRHWLAAAAALTLAGCGSAPPVVQHQAARPSATITTAPPAAAVTTTPPAPPATAAAVPVLTPGHSATFTIRPYAGGSATSLTWTMGSHVVIKTRGAYGATEPAGYEALGFQVTIRNNGPAPTEGSPDYGSSLTWTGNDGRSDDTLARSAALLGADDLGLTGTEITLQSSLPPGGYVSGYLIWEIPVAPGYVTLLSGTSDGFSTYPVLRIDY